MALSRCSNATETRYNFIFTNFLSKRTVLCCSTSAPPLRRWRFGHEELFAQLEAKSALAEKKLLHGATRLDLFFFCLLHHYRIAA